MFFHFADIKIVRIFAGEFGCESGIETTFKVLSFYVTAKNIKAAKAGLKSGYNLQEEGWLRSAFFFKKKIFTNHT